MTMIGRWKSRHYLESSTPYLFIFPAAILILVFHLLPIIISFGLSLYDWDMIGRARFIGVQNYLAIMTDGQFWKSMVNTLYYVAGTVPFSLAISLGIAVVLNRQMIARGFYRTIYFLPVITSLNAVALVWTWIYHPKFGLLNGFLSFFGLAPQEWLLEPKGFLAILLDPMLEKVGWSLPSSFSGPSLALTAIIVMSIWKGLGYNIVVLLAGLGNIPKELYEAARIDGAGPWTSFRHITLPMLMPTLSFLMITSTISSFQVFNQVYMMTQPPGGPLGTTTVAVFYLYQKGFVDFEMGYASAIALVLFLIILGITMIQYRSGGVHQAY
jgi:multiple sugar transport system permease protein